MGVAALCVAQARANGSSHPVPCNAGALVASGLVAADPGFLYQLAATVQRPPVQGWAFGFKVGRRCAVPAGLAPLLLDSLGSHMQCQVSRRGHWVALSLLCSCG